MTSDSQPAKSPIMRFAPLAIIAAALAAFFALGGPDYVNLEALRTHQDSLESFAANNLVLALGGFIILYAALVAISFPGAGYLSIFAGFMFGLLPGTFAVVIGASIGATIIFLIVRSALGQGLAKKAGKYIEKFEQGLKENELSYLFILRLVPLFPFFIVNIVPALFDVKLRNYILTTVFGIIPGSFVYVSVGNGIGDALAAGEDVPLSGLMTRPSVLIPIIGLILLALIPVIYKKFRKSQ